MRLDWPIAIIVIFAWLLAFFGIAIALMKRRDV
jgi:hypothetical protein